MAGGKSVGENYAFAGMHHIFDDHVGYAGNNALFVFALTYSRFHLG